MKLYSNTDLLNTLLSDAANYDITNFTDFTDICFSARREDQFYADLLYILADFATATKSYSAKKYKVFFEHLWLRIDQQQKSYIFRNALQVKSNYFFKLIAKKELLSFVDGELGNNLLITSVELDRVKYFLEMLKSCHVTDIEVLLCLNFPNAEHKNALISAVTRGSLKDVDTLIKHGANPKIIDDLGRNLLHITAALGHFDVAKFLIESKFVDINRQDKDFSAPLHLAVKAGHLHIIKLLAEYGADLNVSNAEHSAPIHLAAKAGYLDIIEYFLGLGIDVNLRNLSNKNTPLHFAASMGHTNIIKMLIDKGANIDEQGWCQETPLQIAAKNGKEQALGELLARGAEIDSKDDKGCTALHAAAEAGHVNILKILLAKGAKPHQRNNSGLTAFEVAIENNKTEIFNFFTDIGFDLTKRDKDGFLQWIVPLGPSAVNNISLRHDSAVNNLAGFLKKEKYSVLPGYGLGNYTQASISKNIQSITLQRSNSDISFFAFKVFVVSSALVNFVQTYEEKTVFDGALYTVTIQSFLATIFFLCSAICYGPTLEKEVPSVTAIVEDPSYDDNQLDIQHS